MITYGLGLICLLIAFLLFMYDLKKSIDNESLLEVILSVLKLVAWAVCAGLVITHCTPPELQRPNRIVCSEYTIEQVKASVNDSVVSVKYIIKYKKYKAK